MADLQLMSYSCSGKMRRFVQSTVLRQDTEPLLAKRRGECNRCGACCKILFRCPFLGTDAEGQYTCRIYEYRFAQCRLYPLHAADLRELEGSAATPSRPSRRRRRRRPARARARVARPASRDAPEEHAEHRDRRRPVGRRRQGQDRRPAHRDGSRWWRATTAATTPATPSSSEGRKFVLHLIPSRHPAPGRCCA